MKKKLYFDLDGTLVDLYGVDGWLDDLIKESVRPYVEARPLVNMARLEKELNRLHDEGYTIGVITCLSKSGSKFYNDFVSSVKRSWLMAHFVGFRFDEIHCIEYTDHKEKFGDGILFDDNDEVRKNWTKAGNRAYDVDDILEVLKKL